MRSHDDTTASAIDALATCRRTSSGRYYPRAAAWPRNGTDNLPADREPEAIHLPRRRLVVCPRSGQRRRERDNGGGADKAFDGQDRRARLLASPRIRQASGLPAASLRRAGVVQEERDDPRRLEREDPLAEDRRGRAANESLRQRQDGRIARRISDAVSSFDISDAVTSWRRERHRTSRGQFRRRTGRMFQLSRQLGRRLPPGRDRGHRQHLDRRRVRNSRRRPSIRPSCGSPWATRRKPAVIPCAS